jgi:hypothetical protein
LAGRRNQWRLIALQRLRGCAHGQDDAIRNWQQSIESVDHNDRRPTARRAAVRCTPPGCWTLTECWSRPTTKEPNGDRAARPGPARSGFDLAGWSRPSIFGRSGRWVVGAVVARCQQHRRARLWPGCALQSPAPRKTVRTEGRPPPTRGLGLLWRGGVTKVGRHGMALGPRAHSGEQQAQDQGL